MHITPQPISQDIYLNPLNEPFVHAEHMTLIDKGNKVSLFGAFITSIFFTYILYGHVTHLVLFGWFAAVCVIYCVRFIAVSVIYKLRDNSRNSYKWERINIIGTVVAGLTWGLGGYYMMPIMNPLLQAVIVLSL